MELKDFYYVLEHLSSVRNETLIEAHDYAQRETMNSNSDLVRLNGIVAQKCIPRIQDELNRRGISY